MEDNLRFIVLKSAKELGEKVNAQINVLRKNEKNYIVPITENRFSNGEGKVILNESVRDKDVYILGDTGNHSCTYSLFGYENHMGPDEHFQDVKRVISAIKGLANSIHVVMPLLYSSRQHKRKGRESLDCAIALQELEALGVNSIITFDAHDPNVQNAIPCMPFENFYPTVSMLSDFIEQEILKGMVDYKNLIVVSPDTGAMDRARYYADMLKTDVGMFHKRRDLSIVKDGKNPVVAHEYLGKDVKDKDIIVVDDMIDSGGSMLEVVSQLKQREARKVYLFSTFALFSKGISKFQEYYENGFFDKLYSTNLTYVTDEVKNSSWFYQVDCAPYLAEIINVLDKHQAISPVINDKAKVLSKLPKQN